MTRNRQKQKSEYPLIHAALTAGSAFAVWQIQEQRRFRTTYHRYLTAKTVSDLRIVSLADLHDHRYGPDNTLLTDTVEDLKPDLIVIPGDFFTHHRNDAKARIPERTVYTMCVLSEIAPVYYTFGNHESAMMEKTRYQRELMMKILQRLKEAGVHVLRNAREKITVNGTPVEVAGFEPDPAYYIRGSHVRLRDGYLEQCIGRGTDPQALQILLAHPPSYFEQYAATDADVVFSGHTHGGLVRIPGIGSVFSPDFSLFPYYDKPVVTGGGTTMYVSKGLGTHTFHLRVFDPAEIVVVDIKPLN